VHVVDAVQLLVQRLEALLLLPGESLKPAYRLLLHLQEMVGVFVLRLLQLRVFLPYSVH
jgi:hypothetical protein